MQELLDKVRRRREGETDLAEDRFAARESLLSYYQTTSLCKFDPQKDLQSLIHIAVESEVEDRRHFLSEMEQVICSIALYSTHYNDVILVQ